MCFTGMNVTKTILPKCQETMRLKRKRYNSWNQENSRTQWSDLCVCLWSPPFRSLWCFLHKNETMTHADISVMYYHISSVGFSLFIFTSSENWTPIFTKVVFFEYANNTSDYNNCSISVCSFSVLQWSYLVTSAGHSKARECQEERELLNSYITTNIKHGSELMIQETKKSKPKQRWMCIAGSLHLWVQIRWWPQLHISPSALTSLTLL